MSVTETLTIPLTYQEGMSKIQRKAVLINRTYAIAQIGFIALVALVFLINQPFFAVAASFAALFAQDLIDFFIGV
jgi:hypothetical protein